MKFNATATIFGISLALAAITAGANPTLAPSVSTPDQADKTIYVKDSTTHVNVFANETVLFKVPGEQQFAIKFDGVKHEYDLAKLAPGGMLNHKVQVYVAPSPFDHEQGNP